MSYLRLALRSLLHFAPAHTGTFLGALVAAAVLVGALVVGDSVRASLRRLAVLRLGRTDVALSSQDRLFRDQLAVDLQAGLLRTGIAQMPGAQPKLQTAPVLQLSGVAVNSEGTARANQVQVLGVDARFWRLSPFAESLATQHLCPACGASSNASCAHVLQFNSLLTQPLPKDTILLSEALAAQLKTQPGEELVLRLQKPTNISQDAPLAPEESTVAALRLRVHAIVPDVLFGRFSLQANQVPPMNAFLTLPDLQQKVATAGRANLLLLTGHGAQDPPARAVANVVFAPGAPTPTNLIGAARASLRQRWNLADAQLEWRTIPRTGNAVEIRSPRVFLDPALSEVTEEITDSLGKQVLPKLTVQPLLTYFVNELSVGTNATPYSMVTATDGPPLARKLAADEILITQWLADDLKAKAGDALTLRYFVVGLGRGLEERTAVFRVSGVLGMETPGLDASLMPDFPGMTDAQNCRDWDTGLPIATDRIRDKDELYWKQYRGTPKAFVSLEAGQKLWNNRFGNLTAIRFHGVNATTAVNVLQKEILSRLDPAQVGLDFQPVREQAIVAATSGQDFGQLFLGFSFFLMVSALLLLGSLYQLSLEHRSPEIGLLLALGFTVRQTCRVLLLEGVILALAASAAGAWVGMHYAKLMLHGLSTIWRSAVSSATLLFEANFGTLLTGVGTAILLTTLVVAFALRRYTRHSPRSLLARDLSTTASSFRPKSVTLPVGTGLVLLVGSLSFAATGVLARQNSAALFFGAGATLLASGILFCQAYLRKSVRGESKAKLSVTELSLRSLSRHPSRSLAVITLLACGCFLVASIGVFRLQTDASSTRRQSGTGGFTLLGQSTRPLVFDPNSTKGRETYNLNPEILTNTFLVPFRLREGDEASCLNLNRAQNPQLLGVNQDLLAQRDAFLFARQGDTPAGESPWSLLGKHENDGTIPAIADEASIVYALGKKIGDTLVYRGDNGQDVVLKLVASLSGSILQGSVVISEQAFATNFPSQAGYRLFLVESASEKAPLVSESLTRSLQDFGLECVSTAQRLNTLNAVQNTYLGTFQILGGLGVLLGSVGLGAIVLRNVLERRAEMGLLLALGYRRATLERMVLLEHAVLLLAGLGIGSVAALFAVAPSLLGPGPKAAYGTVALLLSAILVNGLIWCLVATRSSMRGRLIDALRDN